MATFLGSSPAFLARPVAKPHSISCAQTPRPPSAQNQPPPGEQPAQQQSVQAQAQAPAPARPKRAGGADSTDWVASSLTRRFGLGAGLAWAGFLAFGVVSEQLKTRFEVAQQQANTKDVEQEQEVVLPNGIRYYEMRVGGGDVPRPGDLVVIDLQGRVAGGGEAFVDTFGEGKRPLALVMGSRPYTRGMCEGVEYVLRSMRAGGKRRVVVPPVLGFGDDGADFGEEHVQIPPGATLEYVVQVDKVSIAPA
ncbi:Peptidyl-prolyl cis-trans isomerase FKBP17-2, chloroplastic [Dichanthelium oligosanthes]|uniref:peptidylprolyl isomerase n=1 Tax=Dichanthelium oligosanthes TaxID=888268 RepID=A0A1E5W5L4_9POAL|nr:Peptidyl-prolyl cis-trans isomerase FKBP17-2, chloroplastic [Dichanthelium oligosanthes]